MAAAKADPSFTLQFRRRVPVDLLELGKHGYEVYIESSGAPLVRADGSLATEAFADMQDFVVVWSPPSESAYAGGTWLVRFHLPHGYPLVSPSVGVVGNALWHPNVSYEDGSVCVDTLGKRWKPSMTPLGVLQGVLPLLLATPNPDSPLNPDAAQQLVTDRAAYGTFVREMVVRYARERPPIPCSLRARLPSDAALCALHGAYFTDTPEDSGAETA